MNMTRTLRFILLSPLGIIFSLTVLPGAHAAETQPKGSEIDAAEIRGPDVAKPVTILQNRFFLKQWRPELGVMVGTFMKEAYTDTQSYGARGALYISEWLGIECQYLKTKVTPSDDAKALTKLLFRKLDSDEVVYPIPEINPIHQITDLNVILAPFYGKMDFLDMLIVYSDLYINLGVTKVKTDQGYIDGAVVGVGERFYVKKSIAIRVDYRDRIYTEKRGSGNTTKNSHNVDLGVSYFFM